MTTVWTIGHGTATADAFTELLRDAGIATVVDVRRYPGSRRHPHFGREPLEATLAGAGIDYRWLPALGGRRRPDPASRHVALRNDQFRAYADHMATAEFDEAAADLLELAASSPTAVLCSESVWWRCHRRLLADRLVLVDGVDVVHLMHDGRRAAHPVTPGARRHGDQVVYDAGDDAGAAAGG